MKTNITYFNEITEQVRQITLQKKKELIQEYLNLSLDELIQRSKYLHRNKGKRNRSTVLVCDKCGNNLTADFVRNGSYSRSLLVNEGYIPKLKVPRVKCVCCGKKIKGVNTVIKKHSRLWYDNQLLLVELFMLKASMREIQQALERRNNEKLSTGTILRSIQKIRPTKIEIKEYPREVGVDAFWSRGKSIGKLQENIVMIGVDQNKQSPNKIVGWQLCNGENHQNWKRMIEYLHHEQKINYNTGLINYVSDGQKGILKTVVGRTDYNTICSFHILGNIKQHMSKEPNQITFKLMSEAKEVFKQKTFAEAEKVFKQIERKWGERYRSTIRNLKRSMYATRHFWNNKEQLSQTNNITERMVKEYKRKIKQMEGLRTKTTAESVMELLTLRINSREKWYDQVAARIVS